MGCLLAVLAAVLALAVPASIARTSVVGAYVVLAAFAVLGAAAVWRARRTERRPARLLTLAGLIVSYAVVVAVIHATG